jgi:hypothetical protein
MNERTTTVSLTALCLLFAFARFGSVGDAQTFAADLGSTAVGSHSSEPLGHVFVSRGRIRIETRSLPDGFFLVDVDQPVAWFLRPRQNVFMDAKRSSPLTQVFVRVDPNDACRQWQVMERLAGAAAGSDEWQCHVLGADVVDGRDTVKYQIIASGNHRSYRWVDPLYQFPIRLENEDGTVIAVKSIVDAPQPSILFAVPSGYRKFDPRQLIEQIKQSDVWVESHGEATRSGTAP